MIQSDNPVPVKFRIENYFKILYNKWLQNLLR